jgi:hypothetical protein
MNLNKYIMGSILVKSMFIPANYITTDIAQIVLVSVKDEILVEGDQVVVSEDGDDEVDVVLSIYPDGRPKLANNVVSDGCIVRKIIFGQRMIPDKIIENIIQFGHCTYNIDENFNGSIVYSNNK